MSSISPSQEPLVELVRQMLPCVHETWEALVDHRARRIIEVSKLPDAFSPLARLLVDLAQLIEESPSAEQVRTAVEIRISDVLNSIRALESDLGLNAVDVVFFLNVLRLALAKVVAQSNDTNLDSCEPQLPVTHHVDLGSRMDSLLGRLATVLADASLHASYANPPHEQTLAFEYALLYERTRQLAITDTLTELYNFGYFWDRLREEKVRAERYQRLLSLVIVDIDHFKLYNDHNGHPAGNDVLRVIARILREESREVDIVARYGGEELVILSPETNRRHAFSLAERIRRRVSETSFPHRQSQPCGCVTVSAGVATYPVDADSEENLVHCADQSLYAAKGRGRNQVVAHTPTHKFSLTFRPYRMTRTVALVGNFNAWDPKADPMVPLPDGSFQFELALNSGTYHYKFVLDDQEWIADETAERQPDTYGGENNILRVLI